MFLSLPLFALLLQLFFRGTFYLSNLVLALHIHRIAYTVFVTMIPIEAYEEIYPLLVVLQLPCFVYLLVYILLAFKRYYAQTWGRLSTKFLVLFFICKRDEP